MDGWTGVGDHHRMLQPPSSPFQQQAAAKADLQTGKDRKCLKGEGEGGGELQQVAAATNQQQVGQD